MDKEKIGLFIKNLRTKENMTQEELAFELEERFISVTVKAISDWENGKTIPEIEKIIELSDIFNVSIDEILDGDYSKIDNLKDKYLLSNNDWYERIDNDINPRDYLFKESILIEKRINELLNIRIIREFNNNEESEFRFLIEHFYIFTDYVSNNNDYLSFKNNLRNMINNFLNLEDNEKIFEIKKLFKINNNIDFNLFLLDMIVYGRLTDNNYLLERYKNLDFYRKDMILMSFQLSDYFHVNIDDLYESSYKDLINKYGLNIDLVKETKELLKVLINNGATLNKTYLNRYFKNKVKCNVIDRIDYIYHNFIKPIECKYDDNGVIKIIKIENNKKNRFLTKYYNDASINYNYDVDSLYKFFILDEELNKEFIEEFSKVNNIERYLLDNEFEFLYEYKIAFQKEEKEINNLLIEYDSLIKMLENNELITYKTEKIDEFKTNYSPDIYFNEYEFMRFCYDRNKTLTLDEVIKNREKEKTFELLKDLDSLTLEEIRYKYFYPEVVIND